MLGSLSSRRFFAVVRFLFCNWRDDGVALNSGDATAPDRNTAVRFDEAVIDVSAPHIGEDVVEHGSLLRQLIADGQRAKTRRFGRCRIQ